MGKLLRDLIRQLKEQIWRSLFLDFDVEGCLLEVGIASRESLTVGLQRYRHGVLAKASIDGG
jgi:hypothetical protein